MKPPSANKLILSLLLALSAGSFYPYYQSVNSRSLAGDFIISVILWGAVKSLQLRPSIVVDGSIQYLVILGALAVDTAIVRHCYRSMSIHDLLMGGASLLAPLLAMRVATRIGVVSALPVIMPARFDSATARTVGVSSIPVSNGSIPISNRIVNQVRSGESLLDRLTKEAASTILVGTPGTGKSLTGSRMGRKWAQAGHHVYYIDCKADPKELSLWDGACSDRYQFDGTLIRDPNEWCRRLVEAFDEFESFRLHHLGDGNNQTICILDELPAVITAFKSYKPDPAAALNFINRIVNTLPSRNCHILLMAQNPSCTDTLPSGTIGTLKKIILAKAGSESQLEEWSNLTMMKSIRLDTLSSAIRKSPVNRGCYSSIAGEWLPMENWIEDGDYNRDTLSGCGDQRWRVDDGENSENRVDLGDMPQPNAPHHSQQNVHNSAAPTTAAVTPTIDTLDDLILDYFAAVKLPQPKSLRDIKYSSRIRSTDSSDLAIQSALDRLVHSEALATDRGLWGFPEWFDLN